jgi:hypothetical protein
MTSYTFEMYKNEALGTNVTGKLWFRFTVRRVLQNGIRFKL